MFLNGSLIKSIREERGHTQAELAEICGLSTRTIQRVEREGVASQETTSALASVFEIERTKLFLKSQPITTHSEKSTFAVVMISGLAGIVVGAVVTFVVLGY
ncbi:helix-turn-helix transcriptional regulator [uncultured Umboniibacter sp.]|uniref:helix-turn-helix domain-containing protein n=1 Tax=uncultured Umboniibacter sp. TaxID=1798917 RepID=UPI0026033BB9|nr:helix-turn-helix transcriptional regulator [uncultured Umboniibacter sp.]